MDKEKLEELLIEYIDGKLSAEERKMVESEYLTRNTETYHLYEQLREVIQAMNRSTQLEPTERLRGGFQRALESEIHQGRRGKTVLFSAMVYRVAAAITFVALAGTALLWMRQHRQHEAQLAEMREQIQATKHEMMAMLGNQQSASQRLMGATVAFNDIAQADDDIINALVQTMNEDENSNVRLAALEALVKFKQQPHVRRALIGSLATQKDPVVQISLIRLLVEMKELGVKKQLEEITTEEDMLPAVKDEAHAGLLKLS